MRRRYRRYFRTLLLATLLTACASAPGPRPGVPVAPSLPIPIQQEVLGRARFETLKLSGEVSLAFEGRPLLDKASVVLYLAPPDRMRLRVYRVGIPVLDLLYRDRQVWSRPAGDISAYQSLVYGLHPALFWWRYMDTAEFLPLPESLVLKTATQTVWIDRQTLLPLVHEFVSPEGPVYVQYSAPAAMESGRLFSSHIAVVAPSYSAIVSIRKMAADETLRPELFSWETE